MSASKREQRLREDFELLRQLQQSSSILRIGKPNGEPPDRYTLTLRGKGLVRDTSSRADVKVCDSHRVDLRLPYAYPDVPPDVRWLTSIFHPNVSFSGFIRLRDVGISWDDPVTLDVVCERLWDVARMAYFNFDNATNFQAKGWFEKQTRWTLPVDPRPLRDKAVPPAGNVVQYRRRQDGRIELAGGAAPEEILFIGDDSPAPPMPTRRPPSRRQRDDDDVFYIGDD